MGNAGDDAKAGDWIYVEDAAIHEEFAEVFADVGDGGRVRRAEVDEEDGFHLQNFDFRISIFDLLMPERKRGNG